LLPSDFVQTSQDYIHVRTGSESTNAISCFRIFCVTHYTTQKCQLVEIHY